MEKKRHANVVIKNRQYIQESYDQLGNTLTISVNIKMKDRYLAGDFPMKVMLIGPHSNLSVNALSYEYRLDSSQQLNQSNMEDILLR